MSLLSSYQARVAARGGVYISSLPPNTNLGPSVEGFPGARFLGGANVTASGWRYELAPVDVVTEVAPYKLLFYPFDKSAAADETTQQVTTLVRDVGDTTQKGLTWSLDAIAASLGLSVPLLLLAAGGLVYLIFRPQVSVTRRR